MNDIAEMESGNRENLSKDLEGLTPFLYPFLSKIIPQTARKRGIRVSFPGNPADRPGALVRAAVSPAGAGPGGRDQPRGCRNDQEEPIYV